MSKNEDKPKRYNILGIISASLIGFALIGGGAYAYDTFSTVQKEDIVAAQTIETLQKEWFVDDKIEVDTTIPIAARVDTYQDFGILYIPAFGADYQKLITAGDNSTVIYGGDNAINYYPEGQMPGENGNFSLAGHIGWGVGAFNNINKLGVGEKVIVQTQEGYYTYSITGSEVVPGSQGSVLLPVPNEPNATPTKGILTLTTCYFVGTEKKRMVVYSDFVSFSKNKPAEIQ